MKNSLFKILNGGIWCAFLGILAAQLEFFALHLRHAFSGNEIEVYLQALTLYGCVGFLSGVALSLLLLFWRLVRPQSAFRYYPALAALSLSSVLLSYLLLWSTYALGLPLLKVSNFAAYLFSLLAAAGTAALFYRFFCLGRWYPTGSGGIEREARMTAVLAMLAAVWPVPPLFFLGPATTESMPKRLAAVEQDLPNIILIVIDTLRADHLPFYGYSRQTAPRLSELAGRGMLFDNIYASASDTRPSIATLFTSLYPAAHQTNRQRDFLSDSLTTLAEVLQERGYRTLGVSANANVSPTFGYHQGFDEFWAGEVESPLRLTLLGRLAEDLLKEKADWIFGEPVGVVPRADVVTEVSLQWLEEEVENPFFLYLHYIDPHAPYFPPSPFDRAFDFRSDPPRRKGGVDPLQLLSEGHDSGRVGRDIDLYDGEILFTDWQVGRVIDRLEHLGMLENSILMITSDHGEEFWEHGRIGHSQTAYEEVLKVPFLLVRPQQVPARSRFEEMVGLIDIMPTIVEWVGGEGPEGIQGISLVGRLESIEGGGGDRKLFSQLINDRQALEMARDRRYKLIRHLRGAETGQRELYDLQGDVLERENLAESRGEVVAELAAVLDAFNEYAAAGRVPARHIERLDKATEEALRALGYIK